MPLTDKRIKVGIKVQLWPRDSYKKIARIIEINEYGFTFEMLAGTEPGSGHKIGEIFFVNHHHSITMSLIPE